MLSTTVRYPGWLLSVGGDVLSRCFCFSVFENTVMFSKTKAAEVHSVWVEARSSGWLLSAFWVSEIGVRPEQGHTHTDTCVCVSAVCPWPQSVCSCILFFLQIDYVCSSVAMCRLNPPCVSLLSKPTLAAAFWISCVQRRMWLYHDDTLGREETINEWTTLYFIKSNYPRRKYAVSHSQFEQQSVCDWLFLLSVCVFLMALPVALS